MLNNFSKLLFAITSLAPILVVFAACDVNNGNGYLLAACLLFSAVCLALACRLLLYFARTNIAKVPVQIQSLTPTDKETLAYVIAYLLPILSTDIMNVRENITITVTVLSVLTLCVYHTNAFHFNPILGLFGYHFYEIKTASGNTATLLTRRTHRCQQQTLNVKELWDLVYLDAEDTEYEEILHVRHD